MQAVVAAKWPSIPPRRDVESVRTGVLPMFGRTNYVGHICRSTKNGTTVLATFRLQTRI